MVSVLVASTVASTKSSAAEARRAKMAKSKQRTEHAKTAPKEKSHKESKTKNKEESKVTYNQSPRKSPRFVQVDVAEEPKNRNNSNRNTFRRVSGPEDPVPNADPEVLKTPSKSKQCNKPDSLTTPSSSSVPKMRSLVVCLTPLKPGERHVSGGGGATGKKNANVKGVRMPRTPATGRKQESIVPGTPSSNGKMKQPTLAQFMTIRTTPNAKQRLIAGESDAEPIDLCKEVDTDDIKMEVDDEENQLTFKSETNNREDAPLDLRKQTTTSSTTSTPLRPSALDTVVSRLGSPACNTVDSVTRLTSSPNSHASLVNWQSVRTKITPTKGSSPCRGTLFGPVKMESLSPGKLAPVPPVETLRRDVTPNNSPTASPKPMGILRHEATPNSDSDSSVGSTVRSGSGGIRKGRARANRGLEPSYSELQRVAKQGAKLLKVNLSRINRNENLEPVESPSPKTNEPKSLKDKLQTTINGILAPRNTDVTAAAGSDVKEEESMDVDPQGPSDDYDKVDGVKKYNMREGMQFMW